MLRKKWQFLPAICRLFCSFRMRIFGAHFGFPLSVCGSCVRIKCCALLYVCLWVVDNVELHGVLGKGMRPIVSTVDHPMRFIAFDCFGDYDKSLRSISIIVRILKSRDCETFQILLESSIGDIVSHWHFDFRVFRALQSCLRYLWPLWRLMRRVQS